MTERRHRELLEQVEDAIRRKQYSRRTAEAYLGWVDALRAREPRRPRAVLTRAETPHLLDCL